MDYADKEEQFDFEKRFCLENLEVWLNEALNLFYSAEILYKFECLKYLHLFTNSEKFSGHFSPELTGRVSFNYRVQRMLWAYAYENVLKLIILSKIKRGNLSVVEVPAGEINSHDLVWLAKKAEIQLFEPECFYFGILEKCSTWAGRYPLPNKSGQMYAEKEALPSRDALLRRTQERIEKVLEGIIPRVECESDVLHRNIDEREYDVYKKAKYRFIEMTKAIIK